MNCTVVGKTASQLLWRHSGYSTPSEGVRETWENPTPSEGVRDAYPRYGYPDNHFHFNEFTSGCTPSPAKIKSLP